MAGAAVLLEEWLQELAALAQVNLNLLFFFNRCNNFFPHRSIVSYTSRSFFWLDDVSFPL